MGVEIAAQASALARAFLLGTLFALCYDLLRALRVQRKRRRALTDVLDALYVLFLAAALTVFARRIGGGELRLYALFAALAGAAVFFLGLSEALRPLWDFWARLVFALLALLRLPFRAAAAVSYKLHKRQKRLFLFYKKSFIIKNWGRSAAAARRKREREEGRRYGKSTQKAKRQHFYGHSSPRAGTPSGCASDEPAREDPHGRGRTGSPRGTDRADAAGQRPA
ncbi:MAG: spore cortex biosynthesis protein YabQ [Oscillospiraceae bacterium]|nr:spore cortex biosynthesis protein YabQ [Oscillospiraceae bacterium]